MNKYKKILAILILSIFGISNSFAATVDYNSPFDVASDLGSVDNTAHGYLQEFTPSSNIDVSSVTFTLQQTGTANFNVSVDLYDTVSTPVIGTDTPLLSSSSILASSVSTNMTQYTFPITTTSLTSGTTYYIHLKGDLANGDAVNYLFVGLQDPAGNWEQAYSVSNVNGLGSLSPTTALTFSLDEVATPVPPAENSITALANTTGEGTITEAGHIMTTPIGYAIYFVLGLALIGLVVVAVRKWF